ncbi:TPA: hypothetical protein ACGOVZ_000924 [Streptococcus suis]
MNPVDLFNQVKELIANKDFDGAKQFIEENKDNFGEYLEQAKGLLSGSEGVNGLLDKVIINITRLNFSLVFLFTQK